MAQLRSLRASSLMLVAVLASLHAVPAVGAVFRHQGASNQLVNHFREMAENCQCHFSESCSCDGAVEFMSCIAAACGSGKCVCDATPHHFMSSCRDMSAVCPNVGLECSDAKATCVRHGNGTFMTKAQEEADDEEPRQETKAAKKAKPAKVTELGLKREFWESMGWLVVVALIVLIFVAAKVMGLIHGFIVYFADNVLVMCMADAASMLGSAFVSQFAHHPVYKNSLGLLINLGIALILWVAARKFVTRSGLDNQYQESMWTHVLDMIPWIIRVGALNLLVAVNGRINRGTQGPNKMGMQFVDDTFSFFIMFLVAWAANAAWAKMSDPKLGADKFSLKLFLFNAFTGSVTSCADNSLKAYIVTEIIILIVSSFFLIYALPRFNTDTHDNKISHDFLGYLVIYCWAFSFVNFTWFFFFTYLGGQTVTGQIYYWIFISFLLLLALVLGKICNGNFYGGPDNNSAAFGNMLCWTIDFAAWWAWAEAMTVIDASVDAVPSHPMVTITNLLITVGLIVLTCACYRFADVEEMIKARRAKDTPVKGSGAKH